MRFMYAIGLMAIALGVGVTSASAEQSSPALDDIAAQLLLDEPLFVVNKKDDGTAEYKADNLKKMCAAYPKSKVRCESLADGWATDYASARNGLKGEKAVVEGVPLTSRGADRDAMRSKMSADYQKAFAAVLERKHEFWLCVWSASASALRDELIQQRSPVISKRAQSPPGS